MNVIRFPTLALPERKTTSVRVRAPLLAMGLKFEPFMDILLPATENSLEEALGHLRELPDLHWRAARAAPGEDAGKLRARWMILINRGCFDRNPAVRVCP